MTKFKDWDNNTRCIIIYVGLKIIILTVFWSLVLYFRWN